MKAIQNRNKLALYIDRTNKISKETAQRFAIEAQEAGYKLEQIIKGSHIICALYSK
jgi:lipocalin